MKSALHFACCFTSHFNVTQETLFYEKISAALMSIGAVNKIRLDFLEV